MPAVGLHSSRLARGSSEGDAARSLLAQKGITGSSPLPGEAPAPWSGAASIDSRRFRSLIVRNHREAVEAVAKVIERIKFSRREAFRCSGDEDSGGMHPVQLLEASAEHTLKFLDCDRDLVACLHDRASQVWMDRVCLVVQTTAGLSSV